MARRRGPWPKMDPPLPSHPVRAQAIFLRSSHSVAVAGSRCIGRNTYCAGATDREVRPSRGIAYAVGAIASVQVGATVARHLFAFLGPAGTVFLRVAFGAGILLAIARPRWPRFDARQWRAIVLFGLIVAGMNLCFYEAIARIPLGVAVTIEFVGPLGVAIAGSRRPLEFAALRRLSRQLFGILMSLEPAMGAAAGFFFLGQQLSLRDVVAIGLVIVASAGATRTAASPAAMDVP